MSDRESRVAELLRYHEATRHRLGAYAPGPSELDPRQKPPAFEAAGTAEIALDHVPHTPLPEIGDALTEGALPAHPLDRALLSRLLYDGLAVSCWRGRGAVRWALRVPPSSGNLHPIEGFVVAPAIEGIASAPFVARYLPRTHGLALRAVLDHALFARLTHALPSPAFVIGLSAIPARTEWKYGERALRYVDLDLGHVIAALGLAAGALGWTMRLQQAIPDDIAALMLGLEGAHREGIEVPRALLALTPGPNACSPRGLASAQDDATIATLRAVPFPSGSYAPESARRAWPLARAAERASSPRRDDPAAAHHEPPARDPSPLWFLVSARETARTRRSALRLDARTGLPRQTLYQILRTTLACAERVPFTAFAGEPLVHLALFAHRIQGLESGLYVAARSEAGELFMRRELAAPAEGFSPARDTPPGLRLLRLARGDQSARARALFCGQPVASDGAFTIALVARFESALGERGPAAYRFVHAEAGAVGHALYWASHAAGLRGVGLGCFFDDDLHALLGIDGNALAVVYGFAAGIPVEDRTLVDEPAYPPPADTAHTAVP